MEEWRLRIGNLGSRELSQIVSNLLNGQKVVTTDGLREISALATGSKTQRITVRIPEAPFVADLLVEAVYAEDVDGVEPDQRCSIPCPNGWITDPTASRSTWELFNCVIVSLQTRDNTM